MNISDLKRVSDYVWEIPRHGNMRAPARIYASRAMLPQIVSDNAPQQAVNVAHLPGIVGASLAMPDIHWGYGFPIGGVAAFDVDDGVVSPGGVGYDINCGVRLLASNLKRDEVAPRVADLARELFRRVPSGVGSTGTLRVTRDELKRIAREGARWSVEKGLGTEADSAHIEENGCIPGADPTEVSARAWERGSNQVGTLGSGNHFLEIGYVSEVYDDEAAAAFGLSRDQVTVFIHCGSRGLGHQVCDDSLSQMDKAARKYSIQLPDRQLACAPVKSPEGQAYLGAMRCAVNYAFANRQAIAHRVREAFQHILHASEEAVNLRTVYEVAHNIAKLETHTVDGRPRKLCVHRKGATRAFAVGHAEVPADYRTVGQPVLIPGDMGRYSYVMVGTQKAMDETFGSTCHGAGRAMSRGSALKRAKGRDVIRELADKGVFLQVHSRRTAGEEMPEAYKDVATVVGVCADAGIARKVVQLRPLACVKG